MAYQQMYEPTSGSHTPLRPSSVVFTYRFFQFPTFRSEPMQLRRDAADTSNDPIADGETRVLINGQGTAGFVVRYNTMTMQDDGTASNSEFVRYLDAHALQVEIWDAQSLMLLGTAELDLRQLLRGGAAATQCVLQPPVYRPHAAQEIMVPSKHADMGNVTGVGPTLPAARVGSLFVRVSNVGQVCVPPGKDDVGMHPTPALIIRPEVQENQYNPRQSHAASLVEQVRLTVASRAAGVCARM